MTRGKNLEIRISTRDTEKIYTGVEYLLFVYQLIVYLSTIINYCAKVISLYLFSVQKRGKLCFIACKRLWKSSVRGISARACG